MFPFVGTQYPSLDINFAEAGRIHAPQNRIAPAAKLHTPAHRVIHPESPIGKGSLHSTLRPWLWHGKAWQGMDSRWKWSHDGGDHMIDDGGGNPHR